MSDIASAAPVEQVEQVEFVVNGRPVCLDAAPTSTTLLDFLRSRGLTGSKEGCAEGECGACAVALLVPTEPNGERSAYRIVNSCLMALPQAAGHDILTIEGLAEHGELADAQRAMAEAGGSQCGYCTPGFVMSLFAEHYRPDRVGPCEPSALAGNLCRCTGYRPIGDAARALGDTPHGVLLDRLARPAPRLEAIELDNFSRPTTVDACVARLADPDATVIAGGSDLLVEANLRARRWKHLVSLEAIDELRGFSDTPDSIAIGAALPLAEIKRHWPDAPAIIDDWLELFASPSIRNRATLGGSLATASPIGDAAPLLAALDARVHIAGAKTRRVVPLSSFFVGYRRTLLERGEILTAVEIPKPLPEFVRFYKVSKRRLDDISTVVAAMAIDWDGEDRVRLARFSFGGVGPTPVRAIEAETAVIGQRWNTATVDRVQRILDRTLTPISDLRGSKEYRLEVSKSLVEKFWWDRPTWRQ